MKLKVVAAIVVPCVAAIAFAGSGYRAAIGQERQNRQDRPDFTQRGEMEKSQKSSPNTSGEKYGYASLQGSYAPMGEGSSNGHGEGVFSAGAPVARFYKVNLTYDQRGTIAGILGDIYKTTVAGKEYYILFSDTVYSDGYARVVVWREGAYTVNVANRATQA